MTALLVPFSSSRNSVDSFSLRFLSPSHWMGRTSNVLPGKEDAPEGTSNDGQELHLQLQTDVTITSCHVTLAITRLHV